MTTVMTTAMMITGTSTTSSFDSTKFMCVSFTGVCATAMTVFADVVPLVPMVRTDIGTGDVDVEVLVEVDVEALLKVDVEALLKVDVEALAEVNVEALLSMR